jgi:hypothetical protein
MVDMGGSSLILYRDAYANDWWHPYMIELDGEECGSIKPGQLEIESLEPGPHSLRIRSKETVSEVLFALEPDSLAAFRISGDAKRPWSRDPKVEAAGPFASVSELRVADFEAQGYTTRKMLMTLLVMAVFALVSLTFIVAALAVEGQKASPLVVFLGLPLYMVNAICHNLSIWHRERRSIQLMDSLGISHASSDMSSSHRPMRHKRERLTLGLLIATVVLLEILVWTTPLVSFVTVVLIVVVMFSAERRWHYADLDHIMGGSSES